MLTERTIKILEANGFRVGNRDVNNDGSYEREIEFWSPAGEDNTLDIVYDGTNEGFVETFDRFASRFNVDDHVKALVPLCGNHGVPSRIEILVDDAKAIKKFLLEVAEELSGEDDNSPKMGRQQFFDYIQQNYDISGEAMRLVDNILYYIETIDLTPDEQYDALYSLLDGVIGLSEDELKNVRM
ncbi:MAG: hypothetical protein Q4G33_06425 [bacterium]|nr:hypothetical protein [bacterium]